MKYQKKSIKLICLVLIIALLSTQFTFALSQPSSTASYKNGTFIYSLDDPVEDVYVYSDEWFNTQSTTELNKHLKTLSLIATMASGDVRDEINFLKGIGFKNISTNKYFEEGIYEDFSMGCAVASKPLTSNGKEYTLIAIVPRSYNYKNEWVSNFTVGDTRTEDMHVGFKSARDEILRLVQKHAAEYNISGDVKVWVAGHSRGAAVSNLVAGFLVDYPKWIGSNVTLDLDDMYGFTFGTPQGARESMPSSVVSVVASATDANATPGGGTASGYQGTIVPSDDRFDCIRNFVDYSEPNTYIVPKDVGFTKYGQELEIVENASACKDLMEMYLASVYSYLRTASFYGEDPDGFTPATATNNSQEVVMFENQSDFMKSRFDMLELAILGLENQGLTGASRTDAFGKNYIEDGYQEVLTSIFSLIYSLPDSFIAELDLEKIISELEKQSDDIVDDVIQTALSIFIAYFFEKQAYYRNFVDPEHKVNAVSSLLFQLKSINSGLDSSNPSNYRNSIVPILDDLLKNANLPIDLSGDKIVDAIFDFTTLFMADEVSPAEIESGKTDAIEHAEKIAIENTQALLNVILKALDKDTDAKYACLITEEAAKAAERLLGYTLFGNDEEEQTVQLLLVKIVTEPKFSITASFNASLPEIVTAKTFIQNFRSLGTAHVHCNMLSWMKADDSMYVYSDLAEGRYKESKVVHLYSANDAKIYYTVDGTTPTTESAAYNAATGIKLNSSYYTNDYTIKAIAVLEGEISPVWTYKYSIAARPIQYNYNTAEYQAILAEAQRLQAELDAKKAEDEQLEKHEELVEAAKEELVKVEIKSSSKLGKLNGKNAIKITWKITDGDLENSDLDGFDVFRSTKKSSGYGKTPYFTTTKMSYTNNKELEKGKTYYYKVRAYKLVDGEKVYTGWSTKAWRTIK